MKSTQQKIPQPEVIQRAQSIIAEARLSIDSIDEQLSNLGDETAKNRLYMRKKYRKEHSH